MHITRLFHQGKRTIAFCIGAIMLCTSCSLLNRLPDEDKVMQSLDWYFFIISMSFYDYYLRYPDNIDEIIVHGDEIRDMWRGTDNWVRENRHDFHCLPTDSSMTVLYHSDTVVAMQCGLRCASFSMLLSHRLAWPDAKGWSSGHIVKEFRRDSTNNFKQMLDSVYESVYDSLVPLLYSEAYDSATMNSDPSTLDDRTLPIYILYDYVPGTGLSIHHICKDCFSLSDNDYTRALADVAERVCRQYGFDSLWFKAYHMVPKKE